MYFKNHEIPKMYTCIVSKEKISNQLKNQELGFLRKCILRKDKRGKTHSPKSGPTTTIRQPLAGCRPPSRGLAGRGSAWACARTCARRCAPPCAQPRAPPRWRALHPCRERERERKRERLGKKKIATAYTYFPFHFPILPPHPTHSKVA